VFYYYLKVFRSLNFLLPSQYYYWFSLNKLISNTFTINELFYFITNDLIPYEAKTVKPVHTEYLISEQTDYMIPDMTKHPALVYWHHKIKEKVK
jgi:hypothetical protein